MEGFELIATGLWSIVPPILALVLALITKEVYSSLTIGVFTGMIIYQFTLNGVGGEQLVASFTMVPQMMAEQIAGNGALLLFLALLGALTVVIATAGGSRAYAEWVTTHVKNARAASILTALLGIIIFVDDYFNCLTVGAVMRPVTDKFRVSHEKLAWIIDSTAAPVCIIAPVSSWAVAVGGYMGEDGFNTFVASIPYNFYALLTIFFVFFMLFLQKDFGPMAAAQADAEGRIPAEGSALEAVSLARIADKAQVDLEGAPNIPTVVTEEGDIDDAAAGAIEEYKGLNISDRGTIWDLIVPILVLIVFSILGMMYMGGVAGLMGAFLYENSVEAPVPFVGMLIALVCALVCSGLGALIYSVLTISLRANQNVTGLALTTFGMGFGNFFGGSLSRLAGGVGQISTQATASAFRAKIPVLSTLPVVGEVLFSYGFLTYFSIVLTVVLSWFLYRTRKGLNLRAVGENAATADAAGVNVTAYKYLATLVGGMLAGLGGLYFVMEYTGGTWVNNGFGDRGWLAIALVIFARWRPLNAIWGSILFGGLYILYLYIPGLDRSMQEIFKALPYVVTIVVLVITSLRKKREDQPPMSLGVAYFREDRG